MGELDSGVPTFVRIPGASMARLRPVLGDGKGGQHQRSFVSKKFGEVEIGALRIRGESLGWWFLVLAVLPF